MTFSNIKKSIEWTLWGEGGGGFRITSIGRYLKFFWFVDAPLNFTHFYFIFIFNSTFLFVYSLSFFSSFIYVSIIYIYISNLYVFIFQVLFNFPPFISVTLLSLLHFLFVVRFLSFLRFLWFLTHYSTRIIFHNGLNL